MPVRLKDIDTTLRKLLKPEEFDDYCPNGIQVEGKEKIQKIVTGVTASRALIEAAIVKEADLIFGTSWLFLERRRSNYYWLEKGTNPTLA